MYAQFHRVSPQSKLMKHSDVEQSRRKSFTSRLLKKSSDHVSRLFFSAVFDTSPERGCDKYYRKQNERIDPKT